MKKKAIISSLILVLVVLLIGVFYYIKSSKLNISIPAPNRIITYNHGQSKILTSNDKNFNDIVKLINDRFEKSNSYNLKHSSKNVSSLYKNKLSWECLEFIYDGDKSLKLKNKNIKYRKLFFTIRSENNSDYGTDFAYGDKEYIAEVFGLYNNKEVMTNLLDIIDKEMK
ncbi:hypothetical protein HBE96_09600 [Clostridium sp. P21]|uniref:Uncharacterized protein n=1 Tax=Clostridium muellerianum TaxID=2716538 RepID=A0A7Y0EGD8_9CLOT|nr:hypothetical protein [Clostridium muellerianum]NMM62953.1 hypothetical protein [Clostridium muellerianum]